jgi:hypothetical protein
MGCTNDLDRVDGLLAATALVHDLVLVTRNLRDAERTGARLCDPTAALWSSRGPAVGRSGPITASTQPTARSPRARGS